MSETNPSAFVLPRQQYKIAGLFPDREYFIPEKGWEPGGGGGEVKWKGPRNSFCNEEQKICDLFNAAKKNRGQNIVVEIMGDADDIHDPNL